MVIGELADIDPFGSRGELSQVVGRGQPVVEDHIGLAQRGAGLQGQQAGRTWTTADQGDTASPRGGFLGDDQHVQVAGEFTDPFPEGGGQAHIDDQPGRSDQSEQPSRVARGRSGGVAHRVDPVGGVG